MKHLPVTEVKVLDVETGEYLTGITEISLFDVLEDDKWVFRGACEYTELETLPNGESVNNYRKMDFYLNDISIVDSVKIFHVEKIDTSIKLSDEAFDAIMNSIENPSEPTEALRELMKEYKDSL